MGVAADCATLGNILGKEVSEAQQADEERQDLAHNSQEVSIKVILKLESDAFIPLPRLILYSPWDPYGLPP